MKIEYDWDKRTKTYTCNCGYKCVEGIDLRYSRIIEGDEPFIEIEDKLHSPNTNYGYGDSVSHKIYACPKCGMLQIEV